MRYIGIRCLGAAGDDEYGVCLIDGYILLGITHHTRSCRCCQPHTQTHLSGAAAAAVFSSYSSSCASFICVCFFLSNYLRERMALAHMPLLLSHAHSLLF